jgi:hypothetical protein
MYMQEAYYSEPLKDVIFIKGSAYEFGNETAGKTTYEVHKNRIMKFALDQGNIEVNGANEIVERINKGEAVKAREISRKLIGKNSKYETFEKGEHSNSLEVGEDESISKVIENNEKLSQKVPSFA